MFIKSSHNLCKPGFPWSSHSCVYLDSEQRIPCICLSSSSSVDSKDPTFLATPSAADNIGQEESHRTASSTFASIGKTHSNHKSQASIAFNNKWQQQQLQLPIHILFCNQLLRPREGKSLAPKHYYYQQQMGVLSVLAIQRQYNIHTHRPLNPHHRIYQLLTSCCRWDDASSLARICTLWINT